MPYQVVIVLNKGKSKLDKQANSFGHLRCF